MTWGTGVFLRRSSEIRRISGGLGSALLWLSPHQTGTGLPGHRHGVACAAVSTSTVTRALSGKSSRKLTTVISTKEADSTLSSELRSTADTVSAEPSVPGRTEPERRALETAIWRGCEQGTLTGVHGGCCSGPALVPLSVRAQPVLGPPVLLLDPSEPLAGRRP